MERTQTREEGFGELTLPSPPFQPGAQPGFTCAANEKQMIKRWDGLETGRLALLRGVLQLVPSLLPVFRDEPRRASQLDCCLPLVLLQLRLYLLEDEFKHCQFQ